MFSFRHHLAPFSLFAVTAIAALAFSGCASEYVSLVKLGNPYGQSYSVVVSKTTYTDAEWKQVADYMVQKHNASLVIYDNSVDESRVELAKHMPRYTAFVARPEECGRDYIASIHRLTRRLDDDPYLDTQWGVITGSDAENALRVASSAKPLTVQSALATTGLNAALFDEYFLLSDANPPGSWLWKKPDGSTTRGRDNLPKNEAKTWAEHFETTPFDLVVTSSHGFENGVEMPFGRGIIRAVDGNLYALTNPKQQKPGPEDTALAPSSNPKVYFPVGNCLVGHVNNQHCMVTTMMGPNGVNQMAGYTVNTWFGRGGWDMLNIWQTIPGRNTFSESFFFNQQWMLHDIAQLDPNALEYKMPLGTGDVNMGPHIKAMMDMKLKLDPRKIKPGSKLSPDTQLAGLLWDIDTVAFYGDPAWKAAFEPTKEPSFMSAGITTDGDEHTFEMEILDNASAMANNAPLGVIFTTRISDVKIISGQQYDPIVSDNFILLLKPKPQAGERFIVVKFSGKVIK
ncbi:MAG: hypothetical protein LBV12_02290 [Puniceicoccales bacterium]|jgi:zinc protease|nr:hypothetical protein [Puniceicoccales bacterium]